MSDTRTVRFHAGPARAPTAPISAIFLQSPMRTDTPRPIHLEDYRPSNYLIDTVDLDIALDPTATTVAARLAIRPNPAHRGKHGALKLDGEMLRLDEIKLDGKVLKPGAYKLSATHLTIPDVPARPFVLETRVTINPQANKALQGLYRSRGMFCTQCEAEGLPADHLLSSTGRMCCRSTPCRVEADTQLASRAARQRQSRRSAARSTAASATTRSGRIRTPSPATCSPSSAAICRSIASTVHDHVGPQGRPRASTSSPARKSAPRWAMDASKRSMAWDERRFGREYDLDVFNIVAVSDFNMGAMENKGLNIFNDRLILASPDTATDAIYEAIESVVAHEYFHNWTGNRITCRDWFQLCLKEGLTVFRDQEFSADERSPTVQRITDVRQLQGAAVSRGCRARSRIPCGPTAISRSTTSIRATVYEKGAELVRMIADHPRAAMASAKGMDLYFERHDGDAATVEDFVACFEDASGARSDAVHDRGIGRPARRNWSARSTGTARSKTADLTVEQIHPADPGRAQEEAAAHSRPAGSARRQRAAICRSSSPTGGELADGVVHVTQARGDVPLHRRPVAAGSRRCCAGFSAPVNLTIDLSDRDLEFLMANDSDLFNRWQAANAYATRALMPASSRLCRTASAAARAAPSPGRSAPPSPTTASTRPTARKCSSCRRKPTSPARSAATSIPSLIHRARGSYCGSSAPRSGTTLEAIYAANADARGLLARRQRAPAGGRCATPR